jgi:hypothetical protein
MGVFWIDHALPFHCSANAVSKLPFPNDPMAVQAIADVHDTPSSELAALLDLGLEDDIPLPHALGPPEVRAILSDSDDPVAAVARALSALVIAGKIRIYRGHWDDPDPPRVSPEEAVQLLPDRAWFSFHIDDPNEQRLWFVNVENIRPEYR